MSFEFTFIEIMDMIGTIAFALSGAAVAARKGMDIFGINILALVTATGGGSYTRCYRRYESSSCISKSNIFGCVANYCKYSFHHHEFEKGKD